MMAIISSIGEPIPKGDLPTLLENPEPDFASVENPPAFTEEPSYSAEQAGSATGPSDNLPALVKAWSWQTLPPV